MASHHPNGLLASSLCSRFRGAATAPQTIELAQGIVLMEAGDLIKQVYFPHGGHLPGGEPRDRRNGRGGHDRPGQHCGGSSALDGKVALNKAIVQIAGEASVLEICRLCAAWPMPALNFGPCSSGTIN